MAMPKPTDDDMARFRALVPEAPGVEVKPMFGNLGGFVNGNMFAGLFGSAIGLRLAADQRGALLDHVGAGPFGPEDRPMKEYVAVPPQWSDDQIAPWIEKALTHAAGLPPKKKKARRK